MSWNAAMVGLVLGVAARPASGAPVTALDRTSGVRAVGMGEAYTAADDDVFGIQQNPAVALKMRQFAMAYQKGMLDERFGTIGFGAPVPFGTVVGNLSYFDGGSIELENTAGIRRTVTAQRDFLGVAAVSANVRHDVAAGGSVKLLRSQLVDEFSTTAVLFDAGAIYRMTSQFSLGAAAQNLGSSLKYGSAAEGAPRIMRVGTSYKHQMLAHSLTLAFDQLLSAEFDDPRQHLGVEFLYASTLALRAGYKVGYDGHNISLGFGFTREKLSFDFAMLPGAELDPGFKVAVKVKF